MYKILPTMLHTERVLSLTNPQVLQPDANSSTVSLRVRDQTDPLGPGSTALYPRLWRVAGAVCPETRGRERGPGPDQHCM